MHEFASSDETHGVRTSGATLLWRSTCLTLTNWVHERRVQWTINGAGIELAAC